MEVDDPTTGSVQNLCEAEGRHTVSGQLEDQSRAEGAGSLDGRVNLARTAAGGDSVLNASLASATALLWL